MTSQAPVIEKDPEDWTDWCLGGVHKHYWVFGGINKNNWCLGE